MGNRRSSRLSLARRWIGSMKSGGGGSRSTSTSRLSPLGSVQAGVVDVPGHEDFVRTMVAGASGVDLALLVIAADEGIMPQTLEHLTVLEHLGVPAGIPVLTKSDLVSPDSWRSDPGKSPPELSRSSVEFDPPTAVSARSGEGIDVLRSMIETRAKTIRPRPSDDLFRLPIDRVFSLAGAGTVVTGTAWSGSVSSRCHRDDPAGTASWPNTIDRSPWSGSPTHPSRSVGSRLGLAGIRREDISRGAVLVAEADPWPVTMAMDAELSLDEGAPRVLNSGTRARVLIGTEEVMARVLPQSSDHPRNVRTGADRARAPGGGAGRRPIRHPELQSGGDHRGRARSRSRSTASVQVVRAARIEGHGRSVSRSARAPASRHRPEDTAISARCHAVGGDRSRAA